MSERLKKINDLLRDEVGKILLTEIEEDALITVTGASISPTLEHATIKISVFPLLKAKEVLEKIKKDIYHIQQSLNKRLIMRPVPKIRFEIDQTEERANRIEELIEKVVK